MADVRVNLGQSGYTIHIAPGIGPQIGQFLAKCSPGVGKVLVIADENVSALYGDMALAGLAEAGFSPQLFCVPPGEAAKSLDMAMHIYTKAINMGLDRRCWILALGGGVAGDLAGFVAATYLRGVPFAQMPTTLLAQVDSSVGGKVAVNHPLGKNLIGAFYQPRMVLIDPELLNTLPTRERIAGLAEVIKYGVIADALFFDYLKDNQAGILAGDTAVLTEIIAQSCAIKARVVEQDERDFSLRMVLNFGHTIGHAVEASAGFSRYNHGEAVAVGMYAAALLAHELDICSADTVSRLHSLLVSFNLPTRAAESSPAALFEFLQRDKKNIGGAITWVLPETIGKVTLRRDVPDAAVCRILAKIT